jgi:hypothetical protein
MQRKHTPIGPIARQLAKIQSDGLQVTSSSTNTPQTPANHSKRMKQSNSWTGFTGKTLWDWLQLLIVPLMLAFAGFWFSLQQSEISALASQRQHDSDQKIAADNRQNDMRIALDQQRETTLKTYLDDMSDLLLNHNLRNSKPGDEVTQVARARTLTALRRLDPQRKGALLRFLYEANLISRRSPIFDLNGADLSGADLSNAVLNNANLSGADLSNAVLNNAYLNNAELSGTDLSDTELTFAHLSGADLSGADLSNADLSNAALNNANLSGAFLICTFLNNADLAHSFLNNANLKGADLSGADLSGADLSGADLKNTQATIGQLEQASSLKGAIMPDGTIHP